MWSHTQSLSGRGTAGPFNGNDDDGAGDISAVCSVRQPAEGQRDSQTAVVTC